MNAYVTFDGYILSALLAIASICTIYLAGPNCGAPRTQLQELGVDCRDSYRAAGSCRPCATGTATTLEARTL
jgi:hypothetical protein